MASLNMHSAIVGLKPQQLQTIDTVRELQKANGAAWLSTHGSRAYSLERRGLVCRVEGTHLRWRLTPIGRELADIIQALRGLRRFFRR